MAIMARTPTTAQPKTLDRWWIIRANFLPTTTGYLFSYYTQLGDVNGPDKTAQVLSFSISMPAIPASVESLVQQDMTARGLQ